MFHQRMGAEFLCMQRRGRGKEAEFPLLAEEVQSDGEDVGCKPMAPLRPWAVRTVGNQRSLQCAIYPRWCNYSVHADRHTKQRWIAMEGRGQGGKLLQDRLGAVVMASGFTIIIPDREDRAGRTPGWKGTCMAQAVLSAGEKRWAGEAVHGAERDVSMGDRSPLIRSEASGEGSAKLKNGAFWDECEKLSYGINCRVK